MSFRIDFMGKRRVAVGLSAALIIVSLVALGWRGLALGIDFTGGTLLEVSFSGPVEPEAVRTALRQSGLGDALVQNLDTQLEVVIRLPLKSEIDQSRLTDQLMESLNGLFPGAQLRRAEFVGPAVGEDLRDSSGLALLASLVVMCVYIMWRFAGKFAVAAVIALVHDVIITVGAFAVFRWTFDLASLAAVLSVIGYSLNDTIVICDRIRENMRRMRKSSLIEVINVSLNQTLERTLIMSGTTLLVLAALLIVSVESLQGFAAALVIGVVVGTYSSIYVAASYLVFARLMREELIVPDPDQPDTDNARKGPARTEPMTRMAGPAEAP